jgi:CRISPR-associated protein Cmr6
MDYPIPNISRLAYQAHQMKKPQNPGLIFERYAPDMAGGSNARKRGLQDVLKASGKVDQALLSAYHRRWQQSVQARGAQPFPMWTDGRMVVGLGHKGPYEIGFTFHRLGFPYIPGSGLKGVARAYAEVVAELDESDEQFAAIFGTAPAGEQNNNDAIAGFAIFYDAIPPKNPELELDIMTPHFAEYYSDERNVKPPRDSDKPIPISFLTVSPNARFDFAIGWRGTVDQVLFDKAREWLVGGLTQLGVGGKTSAGYGFFRE